VSTGPNSDSFLLFVNKINPKMLPTNPNSKTIIGKMKKTKNSKWPCEFLIAILML
jgi:hypothetical protein